MGRRSGCLIVLAVVLGPLLILPALVVAPFVLPAVLLRNRLRAMFIVYGSLMALIVPSLVIGLVTGDHATAVATATYIAPFAR